MPEVEVHRRLVKSPPELWAELSDVEGLARHLGEFGEIRITRTDPETTVAWEGERARGTVEIEPSGWGTKVTLTAEPVGGKAAATPQAKPDPAPAAEPVAKDDPPAIAKPVPEPSATPDPVPIAKPIATPDPEPIAKQDPKPVAKPEPVAEEPVARPDPEPTPAASEPPARPAPVPTPVAVPPKKVGFFARLFRRRKHTPPISWERDPVPAPIAEEKPRAEPMPEPAAEPMSEPAAEPMPEPAAEPTPEPAADPTPEPAAEAKLEPSVEPERVAAAGETPAPRSTFEAEGGRDPKWVVNPDPERHVKREPIVESKAKPEPAVQADVPEVEPIVTDERAIAVLTAALDALGSAHHRPFSRG
jgi:hypothetical protein